MQNGANLLAIWSKSSRCNLSGGAPSRGGRPTLSIIPCLRLCVSYTVWGFDAIIRYANRYVSHGSQRHVRWLRIRHFKANLESFNLHGHLWLTNRELFLDEKLTLWWGWSGIQHWTSRMLKCHRFYPLVRYTWGLRPWRGGFPVVRKKKKEPVLFRSL